MTQSGSRHRSLQHVVLVSDYVIVLCKQSFICCMIIDHEAEYCLFWFAKFLVMSAAEVFSNYCEYQSIVNCELSHHSSNCSDF